MKLTKKQQQYLLVGAVMAAAFGFVYVKFFWIPVSKRIRETQVKIAEITDKIDKAKAQATRLPRIEAELALLNQQAVEAEQRLPKSKAVTDILVTLTSLAKKYEVEILSFSPGGQTIKEFFYELLYPMSVRGPFHHLGLFLAAVSLEQRIFNVQNINFGGAAGDSGIMSITFTLVSYQYKG